MKKLTANEAFKEWLMSNDEERETWKETMRQLYEANFISFATYWAFLRQIGHYFSCRKN